VHAESGGFGTPAITVDGVLFTGDWFQPTALRDAVTAAR
jgi:hypothetical protein